MKWIAILVPFVVSMAHAQQANTISIPKASAMNEAELSLDDATPNWQLRIGQSGLQAGSPSSQDLAGRGLTIGGHYAVNPSFTLGAEFTSFRSDINVEGRPAETESTEIVGLVAGLNAIHYDYMGWSYDGSIIGGFLTEPMSGVSMVSGPFYGAGIAADFDKKIGFRFDTKVGRDLVSMSTLSLVGFY